MPWFMTPYGPQHVIEPGTIEEFERRDYVALTAQQAADYFAGVAFPDPPSFATEAEVPGIMATVAADAGSAFSVAQRAAFETPRANTVVLWGDSYVSGNFVVNGTNQYYSAQGFWTWAAVLMRQRMKLLKNAGVHGQGTADILARFDADVAPYKPSWVVIKGGGNDIAGGASAETVQTNLAAMLDAVVGIGAHAVICTNPPRNGLTAAQRAVQAQTNQWMLEQAATRPRVHLVDFWQALLDLSTGGMLPSLTNDGIHPNAVGAARLGRLVADLFAQHASPLDILAHSANNPLMLTTNPYLTGTGGTLGAGITGSVAANWTANPITSVTAVASKVARTDGIPGEWQQFQVTAGTGLTLSQNEDGVNTDWVPGTTQIYGVCEFETDEDFAITDSSGSFSLSVLGFNTAFATQGSTADLVWIGGDSYEPEARPASGVFRTPTFTVPAGVDKRLVLQLTAKMSGTFRIGRMALYKVA